MSGTLTIVSRDGIRHLPREAGTEAMSGTSALRVGHSAKFRPEAKR